MLVVFVGISLGGFLYARSLEKKLHGASMGDSKIDGALTRPSEGGSEQPVTFLILGSDSRGGDQGRSDTLMMLRINPAKKTAVLLSIPRDSRVPIPGRGLDKINSAFAFGGPALAIETVKAYTGAGINHYVEIDFQGFKRVVDALGGVDINVEKTIHDNFYDDVHVNVQAGIHHFNGEEALQYVRVRHIDSDFARTARQQQLLRAILDKTIKPAAVTKLPELVNLFAENVQTDSSLGIQEMLSYAQILRSISQKNVSTATLPGRSEMIGGVSYVVPDKESVARLLGEFKNDRPLK